MSFLDVEQITLHVVTPDSDVKLNIACIVPSVAISTSTSIILSINSKLLPLTPGFSVPAPSSTPSNPSDFH